MFKINAQPVFKTVITVPGLAESQSMTVSYRALADRELDKFDKGSIDGIKGMLRSVIVNIDDLADDDGKPVAYSDDVREQLFGQQFIRALLVRGYFEAIVEAKTGN